MVTNGTVFVVHAYRSGSRENHSYTVGAYSTAERACAAADRERNDRGGKYICEVLRCEIDSVESNGVNPDHEVVRALPGESDPAP
jgi:hypothetical protein